MSKVAIVFLSTSEENLQKTLSYKSHYHPKDYLYEREQEKCQELQICKEQNFPHHHLFRGKEKEGPFANIANQILKYEY